MVYDLYLLYLTDICCSQKQLLTILSSQRSHHSFHKVPYITVCMSNCALVSTNDLMNVLLEIYGILLLLHVHAYLQMLLTYNNYALLYYHSDCSVSSLYITYIL